MRFSEQMQLVLRAMQNAPVDVEGLALTLGLPVREAYLGDDTAGMLEKVSDGFFNKTPSGYQIVVNADQPETRKRFTIAHEIGHFLYHRHLIGNGVGDSKAFRSTDKQRYFNTAIGPKQETEANQFAATVLMPKSLVARVAREEGLNSPAALAKRFGVSEHAMCIHLGEPYEPRLSL
ncbi:ImmA/IrrE family metallo-endopeptidase [Bosea sp. (in: a-proteobacteria)]|uniref:ImmA/IrrE family metallo-endopeptidase n=1 Tax=Bosea sp. (in: a-proteobacteria) TaxID=1871050 RepID=UPI00260569DE|nr:ImmA/IrrE family metallo-endopeptidase [Bosea sp. (in: a-proteobacteria)]MCO5092637.1 ImmA/IrrE family metallo-endopeptidase [Bosea sp. (in: a-proteobacteria)]